MSIAILYNPEIQNYDFGPGHAFRGDRFVSFFQAYQDVFGADRDFQVIRHEELAWDEELRLLHTPDYINIMKAASLADDEPADLNWPFLGYANRSEWGPKVGPSRQSLSVYVSQDNLDPATGRLPAGIEQAARAVVKNSMLAVDTVQQGRAEKAVGIGGGLHHAKAGYGEGFCIYNDVVIAGRHARKAYGLERILILDADAHAGNGTCEAFYDDPQVLYIDLHQAGIYPGTGAAEEIGSGAGKGFTVNVPLVSGTGDGDYERIFDELILPLAREFRPQLIIRYGGSDPHFADSLTSLGLTMAGFEMIGAKMRRLAAELCGGRCVDLLCSGYTPEILPRAWLSLIAGLSGKTIQWPQPLSEPVYQRAAETEAVIRQVKKILQPYWNCMA